MNITHVYPPIPQRQFDYCATADGYEPGDPIGYGATPEEAKANLDKWVARRMIDEAREWAKAADRKHACARENAGRE